MSTRANVYVAFGFLTEIPSDAYPVKLEDAYFKDSLFGLMWNLDEAHATQKMFEETVLSYVTDEVVTIGDNFKEIGLQFPDWKTYISEDYGGESNGVANWSYEYMWVPFEEPAEYRDWPNWKGRVFIRTIDTHNTWKHFGASYVQIPGPWIHIRDWFTYEAAEMEE